MHPPAPVRQLSKRRVANGAAPDYWATSELKYKHPKVLCAVGEKMRSDVDVLGERPAAGPSPRSLIGRLIVPAEPHEEPL